MVLLLRHIRRRVVALEEKSAPIRAVLAEQFSPCPFDRVIAAEHGVQKAVIGALVDVAAEVGKQLFPQFSHLCAVCQIGLAIRGYCLLALSDLGIAVSVPQDAPVRDDAVYSELLEFFPNRSGSGFMSQLNGSSVSVGSGFPFKD